jgi:hypothetical protein
MKNPLIAVVMLVCCVGCDGCSARVTELVARVRGRPSTENVRTPGASPWHDTALAGDGGTAGSARPARVRPLAGLRAFPGAEGFGAEATGGRGGRVIYVTNLDTRGPGSLNAALAERGPRYILFKVSGLINGSVNIAQGDVTLAGQTSPGGVIVRGMYTGEDRGDCGDHCGPERDVSNIILRHMRSRPGPEDVPGETVDGDGLRIRYARRVMVDHVSLGNAGDEAVEITTSNQVTIQESLLAETIGDHASRGGMLMNYSNPRTGHALDKIAVLRTVWNRLQGRYPEISRESRAAAGSTMQVELANNLLWDQQYFIDTVHNSGVSGYGGSPVFFQMNWVGNVGYARASFRYAMINFPNPTGRSSAYWHDNHLNLYQDLADHQLNYCCVDYWQAPTPARPRWLKDTRHDFPEVTYLPASDVRAYAYAYAGAFPRDPMDRRLMEPVGRGAIDETACDQNPAGDTFRFDWPENNPPAPPRDTDEDGMPDAWERAHNLDARTPDHNGTNLSRALTGVEGYTNLECYLNELAEERLSGPPRAAP